MAGWQSIAVLLLVGWGAFAFGAVYQWASLPLFAGCALLGILFLATSRRRPHHDKAVRLSLAALIAAITVQVIPWPHAVLLALAPNTDAFLKNYEVGYAVIAPPHAFSIAPFYTLTALTAAMALALLLVGAIRGLTADHATHIVRGIVLIGATLAVVGIVQKGLWNGKIYGFWSPAEQGESFGPFVNRNHFAGWMLMALPVAAGYFCGLLARGSRRMKSRRRIEALASPEASAIMLVGFAIVLMVVSLLLTKSRSGVLGILAAIAVGGWFAARRNEGGVSRTAVIILAVGGAVAATRWVDLHALLFRFVDEDMLGNRFGVWADTWHIARRFPLTGTGLNTYWIAMLSFQTVGLDKNYLQAHNDYLQVLSEGGVLVCLPALLLAGVLMFQARQQFRRTSVERTDYWIRTGAVAGLAAIALQEIGDFSLQMPGNAVLLIVLIALAVSNTHLTYRY